MFDDKFDLTRAVLEERKTMTRRVVPECRALDILRLWERNEGAVATGYEEKTQSFRFDYCPDKKRRFSIDHLNLIPRYKVGEVVAVAQSLRDMGYDPRDTKHKSGAIWGLDHTPAWANKMFVSASECIHQIRITNVRVERMQDISDEDCIREGVMSGCKIYMDLADRECYGPDTYAIDCCDEDYPTPQRAFSALIDKVSGKGTWESNPWVFVYEFELIK